MSAEPTPPPSIETCHGCGKLIPRQRLQLCTACSRIEDLRFTLVRDFLRANDGASMSDVTRATGVSATDVRVFLERGRLVQLTAGVDAAPPSAATGND